MKLFLFASLLLSSSPLVSSASAFSTNAAFDEEQTCHITENGKCTTDSDDDEELAAADSCSIFIAPSAFPNAGMGIYTSVDIAEGSTVGEPEMFIPLLDKYKTVPHRGQHRWLSWLNYVRGTTNYLIPENTPLKDVDPWDLRRSASGPQFVDGQYQLDAFAPGITSLATSHPEFTNVRLDEEAVQSMVDSAGLHRSKDAGVGAFTTHYGARFVASHDIKAGSELYIEPTEEQIEEEDFQTDFSVRDPLWLKRHGVCIDNLRVGPSTASQAGRGAFAKRLIPKGSLIAPSNLAVLKRDDLIIYETNESAKTYGKVLNKDKIVGSELVLNYCFGHPDSPLLFMPLSPVVNFINHNSTAANAEIRWSSDSTLTKEWLTKHPVELIDMSGKPMLEYVALRDIEPNEEIFIDYGKAWEDAWTNHVQTWSPKPDFKDFVSATEYVKSGAFSVKTLQEQEQDPYPSNLQTACLLQRKRKKKVLNCWLPCDIETRMQVDGETRYKASYSREKYGDDVQRMIDWECVAKKHLLADSIGAENITIVDKWGSQDQHLNGAFRHEIGVPDDFFPSVWMQPAIYGISPLAKKLRPGEFVPITWAHNGKPVTRNAHFVGLPPDFNAKMYNYSARMGAMDIFKDVLRGKNQNEPGDHRYVDLVDGQWYVQRPFWNSNMHWVIPANEVARKSYLRALGTAGFDDVLEAFGVGFGMEKLTCFHNTFLGISESDDSNIHADFYETQRSSFDFLVPIIMANTTRPELDLQSQDGNVLVGIKYQYGVAVSLGDWTYHKSAAVDYLETGEFRVVSSIYCSDITKQNRKSLLKMYDEEYPAPFHHLFDLPIEEWHWDHEGATLPK